VAGEEAAGTGASFLDFARVGVEALRRVERQLARDSVPSVRELQPRAPSACIRSSPSRFKVAPIRIRNNRARFLCRTPKRRQSGSGPDTAIPELASADGSKWIGNRESP